LQPWKICVISVFRREYLNAYQAMIEEIRALANLELIELLHTREFQNSLYYESLRIRWEKRLGDSSEMVTTQKRSLAATARMNSAGKAGRT
jgi:hypothetical protein